MTLRYCHPTGDADGRPGWVIGFTYDRDKIETLKAAVPHTHRDWRAETVDWWVSAEYEATLRRLFKNFALYADAPRLL